MVVTVISVAAASGVLLYASSTRQGDTLSRYGGVTDLTYQGTVISFTFVSGTNIRLSSAAIPYTANNHALSEQMYQTPQMPIGGRPLYELTRGENLTISFDGIPAGSLLLNIDIEVNASVGSGQMLLHYLIPRLEAS